jgi:hypothetical protein
VAKRLTDVSGEKDIHGITSEILRQRAGRACAMVNIKWLTSIKEAVF